MAVTPTGGVDASRINLRPPLGSRGLPLTWNLSDHIDDVIPASIGSDGFALIDDDLWLRPSGTNPAPKAPRAAVVSGFVAPFNEDPQTAQLTYNGRFQGITLCNTPPAYNGEMGSLEFGQAVQDLSRSKWSPDVLTNSFPMSQITISDAGRYVAHPRRGYASARPGNHTWQKKRKTDANYLMSADYVVGTMVSPVDNDCTDLRFENGGNVLAITHSAKADLPSNALGIGYGDYHNSAYLTSLVSCAPVETANHGFMDLSEEELQGSSHWAVNLQVHQGTTASGMTLSSPDGCPQQQWNTGSNMITGETIQHLAVVDIPNAVQDAGVHDPVASPIGRVDLGNHVVTDSCGLLGYEGVFVATAFFSVCKDSNPEDLPAGSGTQQYDNHTYAGLNIQVHSGRTLRRNGQESVVDTSDIPFWKYGSDGMPTSPMTAAMKTRCSRRDDFGYFTDDTNANLTTFSTLRVRREGVMSGQPPIVENSLQDLAEGMPIVTNGNADAILGESAEGGQDWAGTTTINSAFLAEGIPTRVRIVPSLVGYTDVVVEPGAAKLAMIPSAVPITFKKPIVDYHVLVSVAPRDNHPVSTNIDGDGIGDPTTRNNPDPFRCNVNADYSNTGAVIYHGIFRINPDTLEQIWFDPADMPSSNPPQPGEGLGEASVMPRHQPIETTDRCDMGWGLHQTTPFRPLASRDFAKVPLLCGAIESGGFYQRGGISHLFDACAYGDELFVSADTTDSSHLGVASTLDGQPHFGKVWGRGQIWPNGTPTAAMPPGQELLIFRYTPNTDPWYGGKRHTTKTDNPLWNSLTSTQKGRVVGNAEYSDTLREGFTVTDQELLHYAGWKVHDWVFPQIELMRYLGREDKGVTTFPNQQHPTLHCSSLRVLDDGQFVMVAVHRDFIGSEDEFPSSEIGYPFNPDVERNVCPPGYFYSEGSCVPISGGARDMPPNNTYDPISGEFQTGTPPSPSNGEESTPEASDNFSDYPSWSKILANTHARSIVTLWCPIKAVNGKIPRNYQPFEITYKGVATGGGSRETLATQTWNDDKGWWSGARISYWFEESGQRAIPMTYGSYPEAGASHASLPVALPFIANDGSLKHGYPTVQISITTNQQQEPAGIIETAPQDEWYSRRLNYLSKTYFVPTTVGFADYRAGANPFQEYGWSGWSQPEGLFDPIGYNTGDFFTDEATKRALWSELGGVIDATFTNAQNGSNYYEYDLSSIATGGNFELRTWVLDGITEVFTPPPIPYLDAASFAADLMQPHLPYFTIDQAFQLLTGGRTLQGDVPNNKIIRTWMGSNPPHTLGDMFFEDVSPGGTSVTISPTKVTNTSIGSMRGPFAGWSYHGPLHYGVSTTNHPYKVDRVWKQVHAGVGYDLPLTLLAPGQVQVRARAGLSNSLNLELETPFHRTDLNEMKGAGRLGLGFNTGVTAVPGGARQDLGQWYLRTNLWNGPDEYGAGLFDFERIHGPSVSGDAIYSFWQDHPTEHFHAGAIPILPNTDYDLAMIETNRYPPATIKNIDQLNTLDALALTEQLLSSVDVHVSKSAKPFWDSGGIITAQGMGVNDAQASKVTKWRSDGGNASVDTTTTMSANGYDGQPLGKGQRVVRTPDGTLHTFCIRRGAASSNAPFWTHFKKPPTSDLFWNRKGLQQNPDTATYSGKDQCGPDIDTLGGGVSKLYGAAFCSDSKGTIHAVIEVVADPNATGTARAHRLYYHKADRILVESQPAPVYDWDWSIHTPVVIQQQTTGSTAPAAGNKYDFRQPSIVCDAQDNLHLVCQQVWKDAATESTTYQGYGVSRILYVCKRADEDTFPDYTQLSDASGAPADPRWGRASYTMSYFQIDFNIPEGNSPDHHRHASQYVDQPKICLRGDGTPVIFYRGSAPDFTAVANRGYTAVYAQIALSDGAQPGGTMGGGYSFNNQACHVVGLGPDANNTGQGANNVHYYDAIVDEYDRAIVVATLDDQQTSGSPAQTFASRQTYVTTFDTNKTLADQYSTTTGLGTTRVLLKAPVYDGTTETRYLDPRYKDIQITTNGQGEIHIVLGFRLTGGDDNRVGAVYRDASKQEASGIAPQQWATVSHTETNSLYDGGYAEQSTTPDWSGGGSLNSPTTPVNEITHFMHVWLPSIEFDQNPSADDWVIRSMNIRWLSVPSLNYDATTGWQPVGSAQSLAGNEDFVHFAPQLRYQRFWGFNASELDLTWLTNENSWYTTQHEGSRLFMPSTGGVSFAFGGSVGQGIPGYPSGV